MNITLGTIRSLLLRDEAVGGKLLLLAAVAALAIVNSPLGSLYEDFWHTSLSIGIGDFSLTKDLRHWVNDGLMAFFFLVVGLEIKREFIRGELRNARSAALPIVAAIGGMIVPALLYLGFNMHGEAMNGWGIPVATDIAFAIGVLALFGSRIPSSMRIFLLTLAIVDDLLAIIIIAVFYTGAIHLSALLAAGMITVALVLARRFAPDNRLVWSVLALGLWLAVDRSGIHASIVGAVVAFLMPLSHRAGASLAEQAERMTIPLSTFFVIPLFAFANAGVVFSELRLSGETMPIVFGIVSGLFIGKLVGIVGTSWLLVKFGFASLPTGARWAHMIGVGWLAGIGFTVSLFVTELAFMGNEPYIAAAKFGIIIASLLAAFYGALVLKLSLRKKIV